MRPDRRCNGGLDTTAWCGQPAAFVQRRGSGKHLLECFVCSDHAEWLVQTVKSTDDFTPIDEWFEQAGLVPTRESLVGAEREARETLEEMK